MNVKKQLWSQGHIVLFTAGCVLTCIGIYLWSLHAEVFNTWRIITAYVLMVLGLLAALSGVFWSICRSMKSKLYQSRRRQRHVQVHTIQRLSSFPPSYEESQDSQQVCPDAAAEFVVVVDGVDVVMTLAPPLYSQDSSQGPDCTWSWEPPPPYSQVELGVQQSEEAAD